MPSDPFRTSTPPVKSAPAVLPIASTPLVPSIRMRPLPLNRPRSSVQPLPETVRVWAPKSCTTVEGVKPRNKLAGPGFDDPLTQLVTKLLVQV